MKKGILILIGIVVVIGIVVIASYNGIITKKELVQNSLSNLDVMLQRRADLIPNLVNTVKGFTNHENEIIEKVTTARANLLGANTVEEKAKANNELSSELSRLLLVVENYPDLKSSENFVQLSDELAGTENRIAVARKDYNDAVKAYNLSIKTLPNSLFAKMLGFSEETYFEADEKSAEVPNVSFE